MSARLMKQEWIQCDFCGRVYSTGQTIRPTRAAAKLDGWVSHRDPHNNAGIDYCPACQKEGQ